MDGFVTTTNSTDPMGYLDGTDLPWYYGFARAYGIGDRYFASVLAQTFPNRRFLQAATAAGLVSTSIPNPFSKPPATGLIWDLLDAHGIGWANYFVEVPEVGLWPRNLIKYHAHLHDIGDFYDDCRAGRLPPVSLLTTEVLLASEGEFEDDQVGEAFSASLFDAASSGPQWQNMLFVITWDEGGGYYDHVPPPAVVPPDAIPPLPPATHYEGFGRYGFRVPAVVVSPWSRPNYVTSTVHDHTSILAMVERKWNLPALTARDAAATGLTDFLDLSRPAFAEPPGLTQPRASAAELACEKSGPGEIPPPGSVTPA
jgi:phospholipase C